MAFALRGDASPVHAPHLALAAVAAGIRSRRDDALVLRRNHEGGDRAWRSTERP